MSLTFTVSTPTPRDIWQELYTQDPHAVPYQSPDWFDCLCAQSNYVDASRLYEGRDGKKLVLPLVRKRGIMPQLSTAASLPNAWGMGGIISSHPLTIEDIRAVFDDLASANYLRVSLRPNPLHGDLWAAACPAHVTSTPRFAHLLDLEGGFDEVYNNRFSKSTRKQVRRAERAGVEVESDTTGRLVPVFYELYERSLERWADNQNEPIWLSRWRASQRDPIEKIQAIADMMGEGCRTWVARHNGQPVASDIVLQHHNVNDSRGAIDQELAKKTDANSLLQKMIIEDACNRGCRYFHLGESGTNESLAYFKERFGAVGYRYAEYHVERIPLTRMDSLLRSGVKKVIGFKDA